MSRSDERDYLNHLFDFYSDLLTERQSSIFTYYYREDYSLAEISSNENISRSAVSDTLRHCRLELVKYEDKLHLYDSFTKRMQYYKEIRDMSDSDKIHSLLDACIETEIEGGKE